MANEVVQTLHLERVSPFVTHILAPHPDQLPQPAFIVRHNTRISTNEPDLTLLSCTSPTANFAVPDALIGRAVFHLGSSKIDLKVPGSNTLITYKSVLPLSSPPNGPGPCVWEANSASQSEAILQLTTNALTASTTPIHHEDDEPLGPTLIAEVYLKDGFSNGEIKIYVPDLQAPAFNIILLSALAEIDRVRRDTEQGEKEHAQQFLQGSPLTQARTVSVQ